MTMTIEKTLFDCLRAKVLKKLLVNFDDLTPEAYDDTVEFRDLVQMEHHYVFRGVPLVRYMIRPRQEWLEERVEQLKETLWDIGAIHSGKVQELKAGHLEFSANLMLKVKKQDSKIQSLRSHTKRAQDLKHIKLTLRQAKEDLEETREDADELDEQLANLEMRHAEALHAMRGMSALVSKLGARFEEFGDATVDVAEGLSSLAEFFATETERLT